MSRLASDPVFAALTRPQMNAGVTYPFAVFNLVVTVEAFLITRSFWLVTHKDTHNLARVRAFKTWLGDLVRQQHGRLLPGR